MAEDPDKYTHTDILVAIAKLDGKVEAMCRRMDDHLQSDSAVHTDHEKRLRGLERFSWRIQGLAGFIAAVVSAGTTWLFKGGS